MDNESYQSALIVIKTQLYWYDINQWDEIENRICHLIKYNDGDSDDIGFINACVEYDPGRSDLVVLTVLLENKTVNVLIYKNDFGLIDDEV